jgi:hypothetical protein
MPDSIDPSSSHLSSDDFKKLFIDNLKQTGFLQKLKVISMAKEVNLPHVS